MDILLSIVKSLSPEEVTLLGKKFSKFPVKDKLVNTIIKKQSCDLEQLIYLMDYEENRQAFYTLKHRVVEDIIDLKLQIKKNKVVDVREKIEKLRLLLYSQNPDLFIKFLDKVRKQAEDLELVKGMREIYFCYWLTGYCEFKKRNEFEQKIDIYEKKEVFQYRLERLFYLTVFESPDLFYYSPQWKIDSVTSIIKEMGELHNRINTKVSEFLYLSAKVSFEINCVNGTGTVTDSLEEDVNNLLSIYIHHSIPYFYPDCKFAIQTLMNKFYYLKGNKEAFKNSLLQLKNDVKSIKGYMTYENVYFYFLFIYSYHLKSNKQYTEIAPFLEKHLDEELLSKCSNRYKYYFNYLKAVASFYRKDFSDAHAYLLNARNYRTYIDKSGNWICMENSALTVLIQLINDAKAQFDYEVSLYRRLMKRIDYQEEDWKNYLKFTQYLHKDKKDKAEEYKLKFQSNSAKNKIMNLIDLDFVLNNELSL